MKITKLKSNYCLSQNWKSNSVLSKFVFRGKKNKTKGRVWIAGEDKSQEHLPQKDRIEYKARKIMTPGDQYMTYADNTKLWIDIIRSVTKDGVKVISVVTHSNLFIGRPQSGNTFIDDFRGLTRDFSKNRQAMMNSGAVLVLRACLTSDITAQKIAELTGLTVIYFNPRTANKGKKNIESTAVGISAKSKNYKDLFANTTLGKLLPLNKNNVHKFFSVACPKSGGNTNTPSGGNSGRGIESGSLKVPGKRWAGLSGMFPDDIWNPFLPGPGGDNKKKRRPQPRPPVGDDPDPDPNPTPDSPDSTNTDKSPCGPCTYNDGNCAPSFSDQSGCKKSDYCGGLSGDKLNQCQNYYDGKKKSYCEDNYKDTEICGSKDTGPKDTDSEKRKVNPAWGDIWGNDSSLTNEEIADGLKTIFTKMCEKANVDPDSGKNCQEESGAVLDPRYFGGEDDAPWLYESATAEAMEQAYKRMMIKKCEKKRTSPDSPCGDESTGEVNIENPDKGLMKGSQAKKARKRAAKTRASMVVEPNF